MTSLFEVMANHPYFTLGLIIVLVMLAEEVFSGIAKIIRAYKGKEDPNEL